VSLAKMVMDLLGAAEADAAREAARDARLDRLLAAVEDQGAMLLELAETVRALTAPSLEPLPASVAAEIDVPVIRKPDVPLVAVSAPPSDATPAKPQPTTSDPDEYMLLRRYLDEREATYQSLAADYGRSPNTITKLIERAADRLGATTRNALRKAAHGKKGYKAIARQRAAQQQLGRTQPPGTTGARFSTVPISQARGH
jgi:hypothetical protein